LLNHPNISQIQGFGDGSIRRHTSRPRTGAATEST
jgi:hypothetical protein